VTLDQHIGIRIPGANNLFNYLRRKCSGPIRFGMRSPRSLNGVIESKKSAEWWNVINDENREWTDSPKHQKSQTQQDYDLVHIPSMRKTRMRLFFYTDSHFSFAFAPPIPT